jgi:hypothetical protein
MMQNGTIKNRQDIITTLESRGFEIVRVTKSSVSIKNPDENKTRNIRLTGEIYEQNFEFSEKFLERSETAIAEYRKTASNRLPELRKTYSECFEYKRNENLKRYKRPEPTPDRTRAQDMDLVARHGDHRPVSVLGRDLVAGHDHRPEPTRNQPSAREPRETERQDMGHQFLSGQRGTLSSDSRGAHGENWMDDQRWQERTHQVSGELEHDGIGAAAIERIRKLAESTRETTQRLCDGLQQLGANVRHYLERERHVTPASRQLERASQHLEHSTPAVGKALQHEKSVVRHDRGMGFSR